MKKKWMAACGVTAFFLSAGIALWMEKPALTQMAGQAITTTANSKLNGTLSFSSLDISLKGQLVLAKPVIRDTQGRVVIEGDAVRVYVNPGKIVNALKQGEILQALDTADVDDPVLHLWQNEDDGTWNVASLIKKDQRQTDAGFRGPSTTTTEPLMLCCRTVRPSWGRTSTAASPLPDIRPWLSMRP